MLLIGALDIAKGDVHATDITRKTVDNNNLAVVAVVGLAGEHREMDGQEGSHVNACHSHAFEEAVLDFPTAHIVVDNPYLHSLTGLGNQCVRNEVAKGIVLEDVHVDVDMVLGLCNVLEELGEEGIAVGHDVHEIVLEG